MLSSNDVEQVASAIYRTEGGTNTLWPYGIKHHYVHTTPRQACINTIQHYARDHNITTVDSTFVRGLSYVYCPVQDDPIGNARWQKNMLQILHLP